MYTKYKSMKHEYFTLVMLAHGLIPCLFLLFKRNKVSLRFIYLFLLVGFFYLYWLVFSYNKFIIDFAFCIFNGKVILSFYFLFLILYITFLLLFQKKTWDNEFYTILILILWLAIYGLSSYHLFGFYLALECINLCVFVLIAISSKRQIAVESALRYLIVNLVSSSLLLLGFVLLYIQWGSFNLLDISLFQSYNTNFNFLEFIAIITIVIAFFIKIGIVPFHNWLLDVYLGLFNRSLIIVNVFSKAVILIMFFNFISHFTTYTIVINYFLGFTAFSSLLYGSFLLLLEKDTRRFLGLLGLISSGFFFIIIIVVPRTQINLPLLYLLTQSANILLLIHFLSIWNGFEEACFDLRHQGCLLYLSLSLYVFYFIFVLMSLIGIPPLIGFPAKFFLLMLLFKSNYIGTLIFIVFINILNCIAFLRLVMYVTYNDEGFYNGADIKCLNAFTFINIIFVFLNVICFLFILWLLI